MDDIQLTVNVILSVRDNFYHDRRHLPGMEVDKLWQSELQYLFRKVGPTTASSVQPSIASKRSPPCPGPNGEPRPAKRRNDLGDFSQSHGLQRQQSDPSSTARRRSSMARSGSGGRPGHSRSSYPPTLSIANPTTNTWTSPGASQQQSTKAVPVPASNVAQHPYSTSVCQDRSLPDFISRLPPDLLSQSPVDSSLPAMSLTPSPTAPREGFQKADPRRLSVSMWTSPSMSRSSSDSGLTSPSTLASAQMSRQSTSDQLSGPMEQFDFNSDCSGANFAVGGCEAIHPTIPDSAAIDALLGSEFLEPLSDTTIFPPDLSLFTTPDISPIVDMQYSLSQRSTASTSSSDSSQPSITTQRLARVEQLIAPKAPFRMPPTTRIFEVQGPDGKLQKKAEIPRKLQQEKEAKGLPCPQCNDRPEGYHGDHELRRHIERCHCALRKVWVCKEAEAGGTYLSKCKKCRSGKTYGANYNAAAHLRRVHFNPCDTPKGGRNKVSQNRGGIGGGLDPPMDVLRHWMFETTELVYTNGEILNDESYHGMDFCQAPSANIPYNISYDTQPSWWDEFAAEQGIPPTM